MHAKSVRLDVKVALIAERQHGVISVSQLQHLGMGPGAIRERMLAGRLHRLFRGVYAVGHPGVGPIGMWKAATLALGELAVLSHVCAAMLWELIPMDDRYPELTVARAGSLKARQGIVMHRSETLLPSDVTRWKGIPVTTPSRTVADLLRAGKDDIARRAARQANYKGLPLEDNPTEGEFGPGEPILLRLCERNGIPRPAVNEPVGEFRIDFYWEPVAFGVEADDWKGHRGRQAFEDDRERQLIGLLHGIEILPVTYAQLTQNPDRVAEALRRKILG